jgi:hypothetical protein
MHTLTDEQWAALSRDLAERLGVDVPEWTDHRESDPGVTFAQLCAFLAESLLYRAGQVPERARVPLDRAVERLSSLRAVVCGETRPLTRVRYFVGQLLGTEEFETEQQYVIDKHRLHNRTLHGIGIVTGLEVTVDSSSGESIVTVAPGVGITANGDELVLCEPLTAAPRLEADQAYVLLRLVDVERAPVTGASSTEPSRIDEIVQVAVESRIGSDALAIARVVRENRTWRLDPSFEPRLSTR